MLDNQIKSNLSEKDNIVNSISDKVNELSGTNNIEYIGILYTDKRGNLLASKPLPGSRDTSDLAQSLSTVPPGVQAVGEFHSHGAFPKDSDGNNITTPEITNSLNESSPQDIRGIRSMVGEQCQSNWSDYVISPSGEVRSFQSSTNTIEIIK